MTTESECAICLDPIKTHSGGGCSLTSCGHRYHTDCLITWKTNGTTCPECRNADLSFTKDTVLVVTVDEVEEETAVERKRRKKREAANRYTARIRRQKELGHGHRLLSGIVIDHDELGRRADRRREMGRRRRLRARQL